MKNINFRLWLIFYTSKFATKILSLDIGGTETKFKAPLGPLYGTLKINSNGNYSIFLFL